MNSVHMHVEWDGLPPRPAPPRRRRRRPKVALEVRPPKHTKLPNEFEVAIEGILFLPRMPDRRRTSLSNLASPRLARVVADRGGAVAPSPTSPRLVNWRTVYTMPRRLSCATVGLTVVSLNLLSALKRVVSRPSTGCRIECSLFRLILSFERSSPYVVCRDQSIKKFIKYCLFVCYYSS